MTAQFHRPVLARVFFKLFCEHFKHAIIQGQIIQPTNLRNLPTSMMGLLPNKNDYGQSMFTSKNHIKNKRDFQTALYERQLECSQTTLWSTIRLYLAALLCTFLIEGIENVREINHKTSACLLLLPFFYQKSQKRRHSVLFYQNYPSMVV